MPGLTAPVLSALIGRKVSSALVLSTVIGRGWFLLQKCCDWLALVTEIGLFSLNNIWIFRMQLDGQCVCVCLCLHVCVGKGLGVCVFVCALFTLFSYVLCVCVCASVFVIV